jgi:hypothetical protein
VKPRSTAISGPTNYCHKKEPRAGLARGALEVCCLGTLGFWEAALGVGGHRGLGRPSRPNCHNLTIHMRPLDFNWRDVALIKKYPDRGARWFATFAVMASILYVFYVIIAAGASAPLSRYSPRSFAFVFGEELRHRSPP